MSTGFREKVKNHHSTAVINGDAGVVYYGGRGHRNSDLKCHSDVYQYSGGGVALAYNANRSHHAHVHNGSRSYTANGYGNHQSSRFPDHNGCVDTVNEMMARATLAPPPFCPLGASPGGPQPWMNGNHEECAGSESGVVERSGSCREQPADSEDELYESRHIPCDDRTMCDEDNPLQLKSWASVARQPAKESFFPRRSSLTSSGVSKESSAFGDSKHLSGPRPVIPPAIGRSSYSSSSAHSRGRAGPSQSRVVTTTTAPSAVSKPPSYSAHSSIPLDPSVSVPPPIPTQHPPPPLPHRPDLYPSPSKYYMDVPPPPLPPQLSTPQPDISPSSSAILDELHSRNNYNPADLLCCPKNARFFVIKSYSEDDIHRSIKYEIWCSTEHGNRRLDEAFRQCETVAGGAVYLLFSVNGSGYFCGVAEMVSPVNYSTNACVWTQNKWKGQFQVHWIYVKDVPNAQLRHIRLENNEDKPVTNSRDTQEVPPIQGRQVLKVIHSFQHRTSIFDDFMHYEHRQEEEEASRRAPARPHNGMTESFGRGRGMARGGGRGYACRD